MSSNNNNQVDNDSITYRNALRRAGIRVIPGPVDNVSSFHDDICEVFKAMPCIPKSYRAMFPILEDSPDKHFYDDDKPPSNLYPVQIEAIKFLFHERRSFVIHGELDGATESDWMEVTINRMLDPIYNPLRAFLKRMEVSLEFPLTALNDLTKPKPDIVYCISLEEDSTDVHDEFDIPIDENKLILPVTKLWPLTSSYDLQDGNGRIILSQLIVERKSSRDFFNCQNQLFGGLFVILSAMCLVSKLLNLENNPVVWGFVNIGHHMELWVMKKTLETGESRALFVDSFNLQMRLDCVRFSSVVIRLHEVTTKRYKEIINAASQSPIPSSIPHNCQSRKRPSSRSGNASNQSNNSSKRIKKGDEGSHDGGKDVDEDKDFGMGQDIGDACAREHTIIPFDNNSLFPNPHPNFRSSSSPALPTREPIISSSPNRRWSPHPLPADMAVTDTEQQEVHKHVDMSRRSEPNAPRSVYSDDEAVVTITRNNGNQWPYEMLAARQSSEDDSLRPDEVLPFLKFANVNQPDDALNPPLTKFDQWMFERMTMLAKPMEQEN